MFRNTLKSVLLSFLVLLLLAALPSRVQACMTLPRSGSLIQGSRGSSFRIIQRLPVEARSRLYLANDTDSKERKVAIKTVSSFVSSKDRESVIKEIAFYRQMSAWNLGDNSPIIEMVDSYIPKGKERLLCKPWLALDYYQNGNLEDYLSKTGKQYRTMVAFSSIAHDMLMALNTLHSRGYIYYDLKPENFLVFRAGKRKLHVKMIDFDVVTDASSPQCAGTIDTIAPECSFKSVFNYRLTEAIDMWSFGMTLLLLKRSQSFFYEPGQGPDYQYMRDVILSMAYNDDFVDFDVKERILDSGITIRRSENIRQFAGCNYASNIEIKQLCYENKKISDCYCDLVLRSLRFDPQRRITSAEALKHPFVTMTLNYIRIDSKN